MVSGARAEFLTTDPFTIIPNIDMSIYLLQCWFEENVGTMERALLECNIVDYNIREFIKLLSQNKRFVKILTTHCKLTKKIETYYSMREDVQDWKSKNKLL